MKRTFFLHQLPEVAQYLLAAYADKKIFAFDAEMGTGKTTLIKELCKQIGVTELVTSPTFSIVNEYRTFQNEPVYHIDFFRLKSVQDAIEAGIEEIIKNNHYCFIEWYTIAESLLPFNTLKISMRILGHEKRILATL